MVFLAEEGFYELPPNYYSRSASPSKIMHLFVFRLACGLVAELRHARQKNAPFLRDEAQEM